MVEEAGNVGLTPQFQQELPLSSMSLEELSCSIQRQARRKHSRSFFPRSLFFSWPFSPHRIALTIRVRVQEHFKELVLPESRSHLYSPTSCLHRVWDIVGQYVCVE